MPQPNLFPGWQFNDHHDSSISFNYKSPRLKQFVHFLAEDYDSDINKEVIKHEEMAYLNQVMWPIAQQIQAMQNDIRRQLKIHIDRKLPLPTELNVDLKLKLV